MFFFGIGTKNKSWPLENRANLIASWDYFHFCFAPIAFRTRWIIAGDNRSEDRIVSYEEVQRIFPTNIPDIGQWNRFGLLYALGIVALLMMIF